MFDLNKQALENLLVSTSKLGKKKIKPEGLVTVMNNMVEFMQFVKDSLPTQEDKEAIKAGQIKIKDLLENYCNSDQYEYDVNYWASNTDPIDEYYNNLYSICDSHQQERLQYLFNDMLDPDGVIYGRGRGGSGRGREVGPRDGRRTGGGRGYGRFNQQ